MSLAAQQFVEPRRGQPLLPGGPVLRVLEDRFHARLHRVEHRRAGHAARLADAGLGSAQVAPDRVSLDAHLARDLADGDALDEMPVAYDVNLFHCEHPPNERRGPDGASGGRGVGQFWNAGRVNLKRRDHQLGAHERVLCIDEKTSLQPRTRTAASRPARAPNEPYASSTNTCARAR
ncbi:MAG TPA: hypothetical protein VNO30_37350 [Kofleriaceae bacterium]|nr:hypothetical protein [Kofleriaceae bacterium]